MMGHRMSKDSLATHQMDQALAALADSMPMALSVLRGTVEAGATPSETNRIMVAFFEALTGIGKAQQ